jgi:hypothetical protein
VSGWAAKATHRRLTSGVKATRPWLTSGSKATRRRHRSVTLTHQFFLQQNQLLLKKRPAGGSIRGKNPPFYCAHCPRSPRLSARGIRGGTSSGGSASATIATARPTSANLARTAASSSTPNASYRPPPPGQAWLFTPERTTP